MKLIKLDITGHTELECDTETMIQEVEKEMNKGRKAVVAEEPGQEIKYIRKPDQIRELHPEAQVTIMPQLRGG